MRSVTIIVPIYKAEKYLEQCLESLVHQKYEDYDIILVDDCSPDGSGNIARRYVEKYPRKIQLVINEENIGQGKSRMKAVEKTDAEYIMFVDSDDYIADDYISAFMLANDENFDLILGGYTRDIDGKLNRCVFPDSEYSIFLYSVACCKMIRRAFLTGNKIDFSDARKGEDIYFTTAIAACNPKWRVIDYAGYYYRLNRNSTTKSMNYQADFEKIVIGMFGRLRERFMTEDLSREIREKLEYAYTANIMNAMIIYNHGCGIRQMKNKLNTVETDIRAHYPELMKNRQLRFFRPKGVSLKIRAGIGAFYWSRRFGLYRLLMSGIALI